MQPSNESMADRDDAESIPYRALLVHIFLQALKDLQSPNQEVRQDAILFLTGEQARKYAELLEFPESLPLIGLLIHTLPEDFARIDMVPEMRLEALRAREKAHRAYRRRSRGEGLDVP